MCTQQPLRHAHQHQHPKSLLLLQTLHGCWGLDRQCSSTATKVAVRVGIIPRYSSKSIFSISAASRGSAPSLTGGDMSCSCSLGGSCCSGGPPGPPGAGVAEGGGGLACPGSISLSPANIFKVVSELGCLSGLLCWGKNSIEGPAGPRKKHSQHSFLHNTCGFEGPSFRQAENDHRHSCFRCCPSSTKGPQGLRPLASGAGGRLRLQ